MAASLRSFTSNTSADASLVITKPAGLTVGDAMIAGIFRSDDGSGGGGITTPAGWTLLDTITTGTTPVHTTLAIFQKIADSSDVAAANFTFAQSGFDSTYHMIGHLLAISGFGSNAGDNNNKSDALGGTTLTIPTFTPTKANTLFVAFAGDTDASGNEDVITSVALATDNPSWTKQAESTYQDSSRGSKLAFFTASRAQATATGTITVTYATTVVAAAYAAVYAFSPQVNGSINPTTYVNAYAFNPVDTGAYANAYVDAPTVRSRNVSNWTNDTKPSTSWTNET